MTAVVLAGGKGTRLAPYTRILPKPLMPIGDVPILEVLIRQFRHAGVKNVVLTVGHMAGLIRAYFGDGNDFGVNISYSYEEQPLGTAGPLALIRDDLVDDNILVTNGDVLTDLDFGRFMQEHRDSGASASIASHHKKVNIDLGVLHHQNNRLTDYVEKPSFDYLVSMGVYMFRRDVLDRIPKGERLDFPDLIKQLLASGDHVRLHPFDGYWQDLGRREDYEAANEDVVRLNHIIHPGAVPAADRGPTPRKITASRRVRRTSP